MQKEKKERVILNDTLDFKFEVFFFALSVENVIDIVHQVLYKKSSYSVTLNTSQDRK